LQNNFDFHYMFQLGNTIVSEDIIEKGFVCNLTACKGACCIDGDAGAPLDENEINILKEIYPSLKPYLRKESVEVIEKQGVYITNEDGECETPLINGADCAYVTYGENNIALCAIEESFNRGEIDFIKPVSCHLYPVRIQDYSRFAAVNFHSWQICDNACNLGKELQIPVYKFVKKALVRKFGEDWYNDLEEVAKAHQIKKI
jgi:Protein of unknown function (DUF3109)